MFGRLELHLLLWNLRHWNRALLVTNDLVIGLLCRVHQCCVALCLVINNFKLGLRMALCMAQFLVKIHNKFGLCMALCMVLRLVVKFFKVIGLCMALCLAMELFNLGLCIALRLEMDLFNLGLCMAVCLEKELIKIGLSMVVHRSLQVFMMDNVMGNLMDERKGMVLWVLLRYQLRGNLLELEVEERRNCPRFPMERHLWSLVIGCTFVGPS